MELEKLYSGLAATATRVENDLKHSVTRCDELLQQKDVLRSEVWYNVQYTLRDATLYRMRHC